MRSREPGCSRFCSPRGIDKASCPTCIELRQNVLQKHRATAVFLLCRHLSWLCPGRPASRFWHDVATGFYAAGLAMALLMIFQALGQGHQGPAHEEVQLCT